MRVLIIDDQASLLESMREFFEGRGWEVSTALRGGQALEMAHSLNPSLVVLDLRLPDMDGQRVLEQLRREMPGTQVIVVTAFQDMENTICCIKLGAFDFIHKPIDINELDAALDRFAKVSVAQKSQQQPDPATFNRSSEGNSYIVGKSKSMKEVFKRSPWFRTPRSRC